jgi:hypothetical protein
VVGCKGNPPYVCRDMWLVRRPGTGAAVTFAARRPRTLHEVARRVAAGEQAFDPAVNEFLDAFYVGAATRQASIAEPPDPLDPLHDAYLAAVAEHLAQSYGLDVPAWAEHRGLDLMQPFFAGGLESLKALLLVESPTAFRRRMLFVSKNALSRPRELEMAGGTDETQNDRPIGRPP